MTIPYIKLPLANIKAYIGHLNNEQKGQIFAAIMDYSLFQKWPDLECPEFEFVKEIVEKEIKNYKKFCKTQKENAKKLWAKNQNYDEAMAMPTQNAMAMPSCEKERKEIKENVPLDKKVFPIPLSKNYIPLKENKEKRETTRASSTFAFDFIEDEKFRQLWKDWFNFRKNLKKPFKTEQGFRGAFKRLYNLSGGSVDLAARIIQQSVDNEWQGLFELKNDAQTKSLNGVSYAQDKDYSDFEKWGQ